MSTLNQAIEELLSSYHQLNGVLVEELLEVPSPLEFSKFIHRGQPFVVRGAVSDWPAVQQWTTELLESVMANRMVQIAITPSGLVRLMV